MAKKIVRGITDVKTITNQDFDTNNVNDLLSDGQYNYIHRKKGKTEEYHNLTDNIKTLSSDNTELLSVTNYNKTTNTATLHPKHDAQKEQVLESTRNTITIHHGENGTAEKTTVDTNPQKVLEHENLLTINGISKVTEGNSTTIGLKIIDRYSGDLNNLTYTCQVKPLPEAVNLPTGVYGHGILTVKRIGDVVSQHYHTFDNMVFVRTARSADGTPKWTQWVKIVDKSTIDALLAQKQDVLTAGTGITIQGNTISASGATSTIEYSHSDSNYQLFKYVVTNGYDTFVTYTFNVNSGTPQLTFVGDLKNDLERFVGVDTTVSNGALSIKNDGTNMKLINSAAAEKGNQQGTFTFFDGIIVH